jgi:LPS export ABC transporter protein LptC
MYRAVLPILLALILLAGCGQKTISEADQTAETDSALIPDSEVLGATVYLYSGERITTEIRADTIRRFEAIDSTMGYILDIDFFDSLGLVNSNLIGDSGVIRETSNTLRVFGDVVVVTRDSARLETDWLKWNPDRGKIVTDAFVRFSRGEDVMTGWGMEADPDLGRLRIVSQVSGSVTEEQVTSEEL